MTGSVTFYLNGKSVTVDDPSPDLMLIDYLRSPEVGLAGPKKGCGEGGCGACTVILSHQDETKRQNVHRAINSCLRPVCALDGLVVTTVEGTGAAQRPEPKYLNHSKVHDRVGEHHEAPPSPQSMKAREAATRKRTVKIKKAKDMLDVAPKLLLKKCDVRMHPSQDVHEGMNPVAHRLAMNNGTQCGYCSVGFVMNMSEFLINKPKPTKQEIEDIFDGNICRCTGYRSILTGMKTFASDLDDNDKKDRMKCLADDGCQAQRPMDLIVPMPDTDPLPRGASIDVHGRRWVTPTELEGLAEIIRKKGNRKVRFVHGNTSYGIYKEQYLAADLLVDIRLIDEINECESAGFRVPAGISYTDLIEKLNKVLAGGEEKETSRLGALHFMARRTAGRIVRNAASLGGNSMLVLKHIYGKSEPFPSDIFTALYAVDAKIKYLNIEEESAECTCTVEKLVSSVVNREVKADQIVLLHYILPEQDDSIVLAQKVALREVNSHSIVNATIRFDISDGTLSNAVLVFGGIKPYPWRARKTEGLLKEIFANRQPLSLDNFGEIATKLGAEVKAVLDHKDLKARIKAIPSEGFTDDYRVHLAISFLYKAIVNAMIKRGVTVDERIKSSGEIHWGKWKVSHGKQQYKPQGFKAPLSQPYIKLLAMYQTSGQVHYTHEHKVPPGTVNTAFVQSKRALADFYYKSPNGDAHVDADKIRQHLTHKYGDSFVDLITYEHVFPGGNHQGMGADQPLFAVKRVSYVGQSIALVLADTEQHAIDIARYVTEKCIGYDVVTWPKSANGQEWKDWKDPILTLDEAIAKKSIFPDCPSTSAFVSHIWKIIRNGSDFKWATAKQLGDNGRVDVDGVSCTLVKSKQTAGGQIHFYMETQACIARPADGERMILHPSSQSPTGVHSAAAQALGVEYSQLDVQILQVGGGYGGKTEQSKFIIGPTAVAAKACGRPVRLVMPREEDTAMIGKRHPYQGEVQIAIDNEGIIHGYKGKMWGDGGAFYDCSFVVANCIQTRADGAYHVRNFQNTLDVCRTNKAPNTAFRSFGDVQAKLIIENAIDDAAFSISKPDRKITAEDVREKNLYERGDVTPFGQALSYCYMREVWDFLKKKCKYKDKCKSVEDFNSKNKWRKRGISMIPVKYGSGYNLVMLEQASVLLSVSQGDGSVVVHQGGVDMGQGLMTKIEQITSYVLNVPMELIYVQGPKTSVIPNPTSTGGSTGTAYNGEAVKQACEQLRGRLMDFGYQMLNEHGDQWCRDQGIDFWNYQKQSPECKDAADSEDKDTDCPEHQDKDWGWAAITQGKFASSPLIWVNLVKAAYQHRVSLVLSFNAQIPGGTTPFPCMTFKPKDQQPDVPGITVSDDVDKISGKVDSFIGFTFSAACSVTEVDILTGEVKIISSDIVYDMGWSLNPALDIGQVEGAFVQGIGYMLTENLVFQPEGEDAGRLNTLNTWRYKPPAITTIPLEMNVHLFPRDTVKDVPENPNGLFSAKEVGEPPLVLATTVFFAVKNAIRVSLVERKKKRESGLFQLNAPATVQEVRRACDVSIEEFADSGS